MQLKTGYKQTEIGVIPEDWEVKKFNELFSITAGSDLDKNNFSLIQDEKYGFPIYSNSLSDKGLYGYTSEPTQKENTITVTARGTVGFANARNHRYSAIGRVLILTPLIKANCFFMAEQINNRLSFANESTGVPQLTAPQISTYDIAIPPLPEQTAIAAALSDVDALMGELDKLIAKKRDIKQATMQQLLTGKKRLAGFSGEWEIKKIGEFTDCCAGGTPSTLISSYWGGAIPWMNSGELNLKFVYDVANRITEEGLQNSSTKMIPAKCILVGLAGQGKTRGTAAMNFIELCTNQSIAAIFPNSQFVPKYLYYNLDARYDELRELSTGDGGRGGLNLTIIKSMKVPLPTIEEQTAIATILSDMDAEISQLEARRAKTAQLKQGMMQELLTGRIRLNPQESTPC